MRIHQRGAATAATRPSTPPTAPMTTPLCSRVAAVILTCTAVRGCPPTAMDHPTSAGSTRVRVTPAPMSCRVGGSYAEVVVRHSDPRSPHAVAVRRRAIVSASCIPHGSPVIMFVVIVILLRVLVCVSMTTDALPHTRARVRRGDHVAMCVVTEFILCRVRARRANGVDMVASRGCCHVPRHRYRLRTSRQVGDANVHRGVAMATPSHGSTQHVRRMRHERNTLVMSVVVMT